MRKLPHSRQDKAVFSLPSRPGLSSWPDWPFARYLLAGAASCAVDFSTYTVLASVLRLDPLIANVISRPLGGLTCFWLNRSWTFNAAGRRPWSAQILRFWLVFAMSLALSEALVGLFCKAMGLPAVPGKALAEAITVGFNFVALKHWTFQ